MIATTPCGKKPKKEEHAGVSGSFELALRFIAWERSLTVPLSWKLIMTRWEVSRATAYRWLAAYNAAKGTE